MRVQVAICLWLVPTVSLAQQNPPPPQPYPQQQLQQQPQPPVPPGYPPPQQSYPYGYPPQQQQYPYQYPPQPQQYPYGYPPPQGYQQPQSYQQPQQQPPPQGFPPAAATGEPQSPYGAQAVKLQRLQLATASEAAAQATWACADAIDHHRLELARAKCGEALAKDDSIPFAHLLLAQAQAPDLARTELKRAVELAKRASPGEHYFIEAWRALTEGRVADARKLNDQLVNVLPGEPRAYVARGKFRHFGLGDLDAAVIDFRKAAEIDPKFAAAYGYLAFALAERRQLEEATVAAKKYVELAPGEPDAQVTLARMALRRGEPAEAVAAAKKAVAADDKFALAHVTLGDALLFAGRAKEARKEYGVLIGTDDPAVHHDGAMREARAWVFEARLGEAEKALLAESDTAQKTRRPGDEADALVELGRLQLDRGALTDAGNTLRQVTDLLSNKELALGMNDEERRRMSAEALGVRAMVLAAIGERQLAEQRAEDMGVALKASSDPRSAEKTTALKGWIAARNRDDKTALVDLAVATRPTLRMALALAVARAGEHPRARAIMEELAKRCENDLEGALTRPRAHAWLKTQKPEKPEKPAPTEKPEKPGTGP
jgi:tetratricopeptide (TPR) repeat protein